MSRPTHSLTQTAGDNTTYNATTAFVTTAISNAIAGVNPAVAVEVASAAKLPNSPTYSNGVSGIGATITTLTTNTALVVDGYTLVLNDRVLVKNEADSGGLGALANGVYKLTTLAALGVAWILTRALDYDTPSDINETGAIPVKNNGSTNGLTSWLLTSTVATIGTDALTYIQFSYSPLSVVPVTLGGTGLATLTSANVILGAGTSNVTFVAPSTSGNVLTSNGSTWQSTPPAAATVTPTMNLTWAYETAARYLKTVSGSGAGTFGKMGIQLETVTGATSSAFISIQLPFDATGNSGQLLLGSPTFSTHIEFPTLDTDFEIWWGIGDLSVLGTNKMDFVSYKHIGFKVTRVASGAINLVATQSDGSTQNVSGTLTTVAAHDGLDLIFKINGTSSVDYYWQKNGGGKSSATNLTTNLPSTLDNYYIQHGIDNGNASKDSFINVTGASMQR